MKGHGAGYPASSMSLCVIATPSPHTEQEEDGAASRWDMGRLTNWPVAKLLSRIADSCIKLPLGIKKAQVLRIYVDNCARGDTINIKIPSLSTMPTT